VLRRRDASPGGAGLRVGEADRDDEVKRDAEADRDGEAFCDDDTAGTAPA
jgi:hypothetical protein